MPVLFIKLIIENLDVQMDILMILNKIVHNVLTNVQHV